LRALKGKDETELFAGLARDAGLAADSENPQLTNEAGARRVVQRLALLASVAALKETATSVISNTFFRTRVVKTHGAFYGAAEIDSQTVDLLLGRALPDA
jgi:hypothetical protein